MATLHKEIVLPCSANEFWSAASDLGALHTRLVPGFVVDTKLDESLQSRQVTFANGMQITEPILSVDHERRRLAWSAEGAGPSHYNAVLEVTECPEGARVTWTTDLLPDEATRAVATMQDQAFAAMKRAFPPQK